MDTRQLTYGDLIRAHERLLKAKDPKAMEVEAQARKSIKHTTMLNQMLREERRKKR